MESKINTMFYALIARKGGVTKSTLTANIGASLAERGYRVVMVESDGQGSLSSLCGIKPHDGFYQVVAEDREFQDVLVRVPEKFAGSGEIWLLSSHRQNFALAAWEETGSRIADRFNELRGWADFVLIDTSPAADEINGAWFYVADRLILPTLCERLSVDHLRNETLVYIRSAQQQAALHDVPVAQVHGIVPNRYDKATNVDRVNIGILQGRHGDETTIFPLICNAAIWKTAAQLSTSIPVIRDTRYNNGSKWQHQARIAYAELLPVVDSMDVKVQA